MLTRVKQLWALPESAATDESVFLERRRLCKAIAAGPALLAGGGAGAMVGARGSSQQGPGERSGAGGIGNLQRPPRHGPRS